MNLYACWRLSKNVLFNSGFKCSDDKFTCNNGECVKKNLLCDGDFACKDGSDEDNCECPSSKLNCKEGGCLLATFVCDGTNDCSNGDDEKNCRKLLFAWLQKNFHRRILSAGHFLRTG